VARAGAGNAPVTIIGCVLALGGRFGIWALVYAIDRGRVHSRGGCAGMMNAHGYRFGLRWYVMTEATREVAHQYGPAVPAERVVASGGLLVDQSMAAMLPAGSVSALVYANRFVSVVLTLLAGAISTAVTPYFSGMIAVKDWTGCRDTLRTWVRPPRLVSAPCRVWR